MYDRHEKQQRDSVDFIVDARDIRNAALLRALRSFFRAPKTVFAKCYLEPQSRSAAERIRPTGHPAANPLTLRGLDAR